MGRNNNAYDEINFEDIVMHTLLDMFEFGIHSFDGINGPYFWNSIGIDFQSPMPMEEILEHARSVGADTIYVGHTHPLSNDSSLSFIGAKIDPRELVAFDKIPMPLGNKPSSGDVSFFSKLKKSRQFEGVNLVGVVFSASGVWKFDIPNPAKFNSDKFVKAYDEFYPIDVGADFTEEWFARSKFPNYLMELQRPKIHHETYIPQVVHPSTIRPKVQNHKDEVLKATELFYKNGVVLDFHPYGEFGINGQELMRNTLANWLDVFVRQ